MKIADVAPLRFTHHQRNYLVVKITTDDGRYGLGEYAATFMERAGAGAIEHMRGELIGADPFDTEALWQRLYRRDFFPGGLAVVAAIGAIDQALWDLKGKALGQPVWRLLGGKVRDRVETYGWVNGRTVDELVSAAHERVKSGWHHLRLLVPDRDGVFDSAVAVRDTVERVAALRAALGAGIGLCVDAHTRLELDEAVRLARQLEPFELSFLEDPLRSEHPEGYRRMRAQTGLPLAAGEQMTTKWGFRLLIEEELIDFARIDLGVAGGFTEARKIAGWAEAHGVRVVPHNPLGPVTWAACLHFAVTTENFALQEAGRADHGSLRDLFPVRPDFPAGAWPVPEKPGLGVEINEAALAAYPFTDQSAPRLRRPDGSFTNW